MGEPNPPFGQELLEIASQLIQPRLLPGEDLDAFLSGATFLATERAQVHDRAPFHLTYCSYYSYLAFARGSLI